jgi:hypothetical protein
LVGRDAAFMGPVDSQYCILDEDKVGLLLYTIPRPTSKEELEKTNQAALDENSFSEAKADSNKKQGPLQFIFETEVDRIFSTPIG